MCLTKKDHPGTAEAAALKWEAIHIFVITEEKSCQKIEARTWSDFFGLEKSFGQNRNSVWSNCPFRGGRSKWLSIRLSVLVPERQDAPRAQEGPQCFLRGPSLRNKQGANHTVQPSKLPWALLWLLRTSQNSFSGPSTFTSSQLELPMTGRPCCYYG